MRKLFTKEERVALKESASSMAAAKRAGDAARKAFKTARVAIVKHAPKGLGMDAQDTFSRAVDQILEKAASEIARKASSLVIDSAFFGAKKPHSSAHSSGGSWAGPGDEIT